MAEADPIRVGVREFRSKMGDYLRRARAGARFLIMSHGEPVAEVAAPGGVALPRAKREPGGLKGRIWVAEDWESWPDGYLDDMASGPIEPRA